jgi:hypothetical protein
MLVTKFSVTLGVVNIVVVVKVDIQAKLADEPFKSKWFDEGVMDHGAQGVDTAPRARL